MANEKKWCVYVHTNKMNGKRYVGITSKKPKTRWGNGGNRYNTQMFGKAIKKYGWDNFTHEILANNVTEVEAKQLEKTYIVMWQTKNREYGYNLTYGGDGTCGRTLSEETRKKLSEANKGEKNHNYGKTLSEETRKKISEANYGKTQSEEARKRISEANKGKTLSEETRKKLSEVHKGKTHSEEARMKMSEANKGKDGKKIVCDNKIFNSITGCAEFYMINVKTMSKWLTGYRKTPQRFQDLGLAYYIEE